MCSVDVQIAAIEARVMELCAIYKQIPQFVPPTQHMVSMHRYEQGLDVLMHDLLYEDRNVFEELQTDFGIALDNDI